MKAVRGFTEANKACFGLILGTWILNNRIRIDREERERYFVTVHFVAMESVGAPDDEAPRTIEELTEMYSGGGSHSALLKPFSNGLEYRRTAGGFEIAEQVQQPVEKNPVDLPSFCPSMFEPRNAAAETQQEF